MLSLTGEFLDRLLGYGEAQIVLMNSHCGVLGCPILGAALGEQLPEVAPFQGALVVDGHLFFSLTEGGILLLKSREEGLQKSLAFLENRLPIEGELLIVDGQGMRVEVLPLGHELQ